MLLSPKYNTKSIYLIIDGSQNEILETCIEFCLEIKAKFETENSWFIKDGIAIFDTADFWLDTKINGCNYLIISKELYENVYSKITDEVQRRNEVYRLKGLTINWIDYLKDYINNLKEEGLC